MGNILNQLITVGAGLGILAGAWFIWLVSGVANNLFSTKKWSWKRMWEDIVKTLIMGIGILSWVVLMNVLDWYTQKLGMDISSVLDGATVVGLLAVIVGGSANYAMKAYRNFIEFIGTNHVAKVTGEQDYAGIAKDIINVVTSLYTPEEAVEEHKQWEEEGGRGASYSVRYDNYDNFRADVIGKGFNVDSSWGAQCWDGVCLLWQQLGLWLQTGNGCAYGCWTLKKDVNKANKFILITDKAQIKRGDVLVFRTGEFGHIGFADEDYNGNGYIRLLGQNQGGAPYVGGGACFNTINMSLATFLGAFRYEGWVNTTAPRPAEQVPAPTPKLQPTKPAETFNKGDKVFLNKYVDVNGTALANIQSTPYTVFQIRKSDNTAVLKSDDGDIYARVAVGNIRKA